MTPVEVIGKLLLLLFLSGIVLAVMVAGWSLVDRRLEPSWRALDEALGRKRENVGSGDD